MIDKNSIYPSFVDNTDFRYIKVDDKYIASIIICDFPKYNTFLSIIEDIPKDTQYTMSIYIQKQDTYKVLKELTYSISTSKSEIKTSKNAQIDIDVITKLQDDANFLRKEIQINNQEIFYINFILTFYSRNNKELLKTLKRFQSRLYSKQLYSKITNFRHLDEYILSLPLNRKESILLKQNFRNFTTDSLSNIFPFYTKTVFDTDGIIFGKILSQNSICNINMFKKSYLNSNMCILGSSGAGKSFFAKLLIIRHHINNERQYVFDIEGEYSNVVNKLGGNVFSFNSNHINILQFTNPEIMEFKSNVYNMKVRKIIHLLKDIFDIEDKEIIIDIKHAIDKVYKKFNITTNLNSLYIKDENTVYLKRVLKKNEDFPTLKDVKIEVKLNKTKQMLNEAIRKYPYLFGITDIDFKSNLISFDVSSLPVKDIGKVFKYFLEEIVFKLKMNIKFDNGVENTLIYIDEIWKYILASKDKSLLEYIFGLFKTIRKLKAGIVIISQDISDIFSKENINYGKSILNNCFFKVMFKLDFSDINVLDKLSGITSEVLEDINLLDKGQSVIIFNNNNMKLQIEANEYENNLIEGENDGYFSSS